MTDKMMKDRKCIHFRLYFYVMDSNVMMKAVQGEIYRIYNIENWARRLACMEDSIQTTSILHQQPFTSGFLPSFRPSVPPFTHSLLPLTSLLTLNVHSQYLLITSP